MSKSEKQSAKRQKKDSPRSTASQPAPNRASWDDLETSLRGLRNLNAMQLELIGNVERIGKELRRKRT